MLCLPLVGRKIRGEPAQSLGSHFSNWNRRRAASRVSDLVVRVAVLGEVAERHAYSIFSGRGIAPRTWHDLKIQLAGRFWSPGKTGADNEWGTVLANPSDQFAAAARRGAAPAPAEIAHCHAAAPAAAL